MRLPQPDAAIQKEGIVRGHGTLRDFSRCGMGKLIARSDNKRIKRISGVQISFFSLSLFRTGLFSLFLNDELNTQALFGKPLFKRFLDEDIVMLLDPLSELPIRNGDLNFLAIEGEHVRRF